MPLLSANARATLWMILSCVAFAMLWVLVRILSEEQHPFAIVVWRNVMGLLWLMPMLLLTPGLLKFKRVPGHLRRATSGVVGTFATFFAVANAPLANVMAISYSAPLFATIGAMLFLGEMVGRIRGAALAVGFFGVMMVLRPGIVEITPGIMSAMLAAVATAFSLLAIKALTGIDDFRAVTAWAFILTTPISFVLAFPWMTWPSAQIWPLLVGLGACAAAGQLALARAFALADASAMMPYDFVRFGLITGAGIMLFGERYDWLTVAGGVIILLAALTLAIRERMLSRKAQNIPLEF